MYQYNLPYCSLMGIYMKYELGTRLTKAMFITMGQLLLFTGKMYFYIKKKTKVDVWLFKLVHLKQSRVEETHSNDNSSFRKKCTH